jgi:hypothetical protein
MRCLATVKELNSKERRGLTIFFWLRPAVPLCVVSVIPAREDTCSDGNNEHTDSWQQSYLQTIDVTTKYFSDCALFPSFRSDEVQSNISYLLL